MSKASAGAILTDDDYQAILSTVEAAARDAGAINTIRGAMWAPIFRAVEHIIAAAEQRGREDNSDHGMCYVSGSRALAAREAAARRDALTEAADAGPSSTATDQLWRMWLRDRATALRDDA